MFNNPFKGSHVFLFNFSDELKPLSKSERNASSNFEPVVKQVVNKLQTASETSTEQVVEQVLVPYINNTNIINNSNIENSLNLQTQAKNLQNEDSIFFKDEEEISKEKKLREKKKSFADSSTLYKRNHIDTGKGFKPPSVEEVKSYFREQKFPELEGQKFFNFFSSIGWLVGGKTPMSNWQASAQNWMLNANTFFVPTKPQTQNLSTTTNKNYSEPL